jgi:hypothetical protein
MIKIANGRILIISAPRVGSTAFAECIASYNNKKFYSEPLTSSSSEIINNFKKSMISNERLVVKVHAHTFFKYYEDFKMRSFYKIRIRRKSVVDQIASDYLAMERKKWWYSADDVYHDLKKDVKIDIERICISIDAITKMNRFLDTFDFLEGIQFNSEVYYEDIKETMSDMNLVTSTTTHPENYQELLDTIQKYISVIE